MAKRATYKVDFGFDGLSLAEQDRFYQKLMSVLDQRLKDALYLKVTDLIGGEHDPFSNKGVRPDGVSCNNCYSVDCARCSIWKKIVNNNNNKEMEKENEE